MTIEDAEHYTPEQRAEIIARYPEHEREARAGGIPVLGSGRVFPISEASIRVDPFPIPDTWDQIVGIDFGWDHPFAAAHCAWDKDADVFYVTKEYRIKEQTPIIHAAAIKPWGDWLPVAWPHDGLQHDKGSGVELATTYRQQGLQLLHERASFEDGSFGLEAGILEMLDRMKTGRWKVFASCGLWFNEFRLYHREDGLIEKIDDDLISASRYAYMMRRYASKKPKPRSSRQNNGGGSWMR